MKLMIVNISLNPHNGDDPQLIFESLNSTGLDLEEADKIRNYVLMKMSSSQQERIHKNYWEKLENKVSKEDINKFIRYYLAVKTRELTNENKLYFAFKNYKEHSTMQIEDLLKDMLEYADFYNVIKSARITDTAYLNSYVKTCDSWGETEIKERALLLYNSAKEIWNTPITDFAPDVAEEWITLEDDIDFTNKVIVKINMLGDEIISDNITDAYKKINEILYMLDPARFAKRESVYHSEDSSKLRTAHELSSTMYIETNLSSQHKINILRDLFEYFEFDFQDLKFLIKSKQKNNIDFDIDDENTYNAITCGALAYHLFLKLLTKKKLSQQEIQLLMTKEYSRQNFKKVAYPVLALSYDSNRGQSDHFRYYRQPVNIDGIDYFISSQWFDASRADLIAYYKKFI